MAIAEVEAVACLKVLILLAEADGVVDPGERQSIEAAVTGFELPISIEDLLKDENIDLETELALVQSEEAREQLFRSAYFMMHSDDGAAKEEIAMLARIAEATGRSEGERVSLERVFVAQKKGKVAAFAEAVGKLFRRK